MPKLTDATLKQYKAGDKRREIADGTSGLFLIIQPKPSRTKSWALRFRRPDGRPAKLTLGKVDLSNEPADAPVIGGALTLLQARELAASINRSRARGEDVIEEHKAEHRRQADTAAKATANSFGALLPEFFIDHRTKRHIRPRHWREDARLLGLDYPRDCDPAQTAPRVIPGSVADTWRDKPISSIDGHLIHTVVDEARKSGIPGLVRNRDGISENRGRKLFAAISVFFSWALRKRKVSSDPTVDVSHPGAPPARERVLSKAERRWFWAACEQIGPPYGPLFKLLLLTGQRLGEVSGMRWGELSEDGQWVLPGARTKNHREHLVPLPPLARDIIAALDRIENPKGLVFTIGGAKLTGFSRAKSKLDEAMLAVARSENSAITVPHWTLHDLRRSCATAMADLGILPHVIEAVLNHVSGYRAGVAGIYNRSTHANEKKAALERWAAYLEALVSGQSSNVVVFPAGA